MQDLNHTLEEAPPESAPTGKELELVKHFQNEHPEFTLTEIRKVLRHCALELALNQHADELQRSVGETLHARSKSS